MYAAHVHCLMSDLTFNLPKIYHFSIDRYTLRYIGIYLLVISDITDSFQLSQYVTRVTRTISNVTEFNYKKKKDAQTVLRLSFHAK